MHKGLKNIFVSQKFQIIMSTMALGITQNLAGPKKLEKYLTPRTKIQGIWCLLEPTMKLFSTLLTNIHHFSDISERINL